MSVIVHGKCDCFVMKMLMIVSCEHDVAVLNAAFCRTCSL